MSLECCISMCRANLNLLEGWACQVGFKDAVLHYLAKFSSAIDLLATPSEQLLQVSNNYSYGPQKSCLVLQLLWCCNYNVVELAPPSSRVSSPQPSSTAPYCQSLSITTKDDQCPEALDSFTR